MKEIIRSFWDLSHRFKYVDKTDFINKLDIEDPQVKDLMLKTLDEEIDNSTDINLICKMENLYDKIIKFPYLQGIEELMLKLEAAKNDSEEMVDFLKNSELPKDIIGEYIVAFEGLGNVLEDMMSNLAGFAREQIESDQDIMHG